MKMPISKGGGAKFRGPTSSVEYNTQADAVYADLLDLYKQSYTNVEDLQAAHQVVLVENMALKVYTGMLESRLVQAEQKIQAMQSSLPNPPIYFNTAYIQDMTTKYPSAVQNGNDKSLRCDIDPEYRFATLPIVHQIPKTHLVNDLTGDVVIPSELKVTISRTNTGGEVIESDVTNAFNGDNESFWYRTVLYDAAQCPSEEDVIMEIELPSHLVNNLNINTLLLHPHPERGVQVKNVEIHYQNAWKSIDGFQQQELSAINTYEFGSRKKWYFPQLPVQRIRITLSQKTTIDMGSKKAFILGAQEVGVYLTLFEQGGGIVLSPFEMDGVYNIESVEHIFLNRSAFSFDEKLDHQLEGSLYEYEVLKEELDGILTPLSNNEWSGQFVKKLWVKTRLLTDPNNAVAPCLHAVRVNYSR